MNWSEYFTYDEQSGLLTWKTRPRHHFNNLRTFNATNTARSGKPVTAIRSDGYVYPMVDGIHKLAHVIIWEMLHGPIPDGLEIDHINGVKWDNRRSNLRLATRQQNKMNGSAYSTSKTGIRGVQWDKEHSKYRVRIMVSGKYIHLGRFDDIDIARAVYAEAAKEHFGEFAK